ncbi:HAD family hydrolase [Methanolobus sp. WCC5]|uniref:HAD family hydrolase n=1 Tax=Methanolobus sp. WCC5 TaxID=3125785 RepID=UPI003250E928
MYIRHVPHVIKALIFDMDGVLIDSMHLHAKAWKTAFFEAGINIEEREIFGLEGENDTGIVRNILNMTKKGCCMQEELFMSVPARKHEIFDRDSVTIFKDMDTCLKLLKKRYKLAVVSGSDRKTVEMMLQRYFPGIFDVAVSGDDTINGKPEPDPYNKAVEMLQTDKQECIVIENAILGVISAKNAGIFTIGLPTYLDRKELRHADIVLDDHGELFRFLELLMRT